MGRRPAGRASPAASRGAEGRRRESRGGSICLTSGRWRRRRAGHQRPWGGGDGRDAAAAGGGGGCGGGGVATGGTGVEVASWEGNGLAKEAGRAPIYRPTGWWPEVGAGYWPAVEARRPRHRWRAVREVGLARRRGAGPRWPAREGGVRDRGGWRRSGWRRRPGTGPGARFEGAAAWPTPGRAMGPTRGEAERRGARKEWRRGSNGVGGGQPGSGARKRRRRREKKEGGRRRRKRKKEERKRKEKKRGKEKEKEETGGTRGTRSEHARGGLTTALGEIYGHE
uniref:Uncharacterized protein n=1 Tax=Setaria viridis TaxID=4556 RepID=A0A4U6U3P6_SETVI|nr:hypothetical protein SEVIR_6G142350v2 [Setaria viridis]